MDININNSAFSNEDEARELLEAMRWKDGVICPHCEADKVYKLQGAATRKGVYKCAKCRKQFTVTVGTIFEDSRIPLNKWLMAIYLMCSSKKGISANQLSSMLSITYKSAWFMCHRIRYAMNTGIFTKFSGTVEVDETYVGGKAKNMHRKVREAKFHGRGAVEKAPVVTIVERDGRVKSQHMEKVTGKNLKAAMLEVVNPAASIMTDESPLYYGTGFSFTDHQTVNHHKGQYVSGKAHVNTAESVHALLKRGIIGTFHHVSTKHLNRYLDEFDFRFNTRKISNGERTLEAIKGISGKRLLYKDCKGE
jgi:transposase-like protein